MSFANAATDNGPKNSTIIPNSTGPSYLEFGESTLKNETLPNDSTIGPTIGGMEIEWNHDGDYPFSRKKPEKELAKESEYGPKNKPKDQENGKENNDSSKGDDSDKENIDSSKGDNYGKENKDSCKGDNSGGSNDSGRLMIDESTKNNSL